MKLPTALGALLVLGLLPPVARAHEGPPYPIFVDRAVGPYTVSLWADPDVGTGTFYVMFDPPALRSDTDPRVTMTTWPSSGRLAPVAYEPRERKRETCTILAELDREEPWTFRFHIEGSAGAGDIEVEIPVTPPGYGRWDLLLYGVPFLLIGALWAIVAVRKRTGWTSPRR